VTKPNERDVVAAGNIVYLGRHGNVSAACGALADYRVECERKELERVLDAITAECVWRKEWSLGGMSAPEQAEIDPADLAALLARLRG
jgi:hypothetical protein